MNVAKSARGVKPPRQVLVANCRPRSFDATAAERLNRIVGSDFGRCLCGGTYETRRDSVQWGTDVHVTFETGECPTCGSSVCRVSDLERVEAIRRGDAVDPALKRPSL